MVSRSGAVPEPRRGRPPRARHDAGLEPVDWSRVVVVLALAAVASSSALATAGMLRQGPLDGIGWADREREAVALAGPIGDDPMLRVVVDLPESACPTALSIEVTETADSVVLGPVHAREPRLQRPGEECAVTGQPVVVASLRAPLGTRQVFGADGRARLGIVRQGGPPGDGAAATGERTEDQDSSRDRRDRGRDRDEEREPSSPRPTGEAPSPTPSATQDPPRQEPSAPAEESPSPGETQGEESSAPDGASPVT